MLISFFMFIRTHSRSENNAADAQKPPVFQDVHLKYVGNIGGILIHLFKFQDIAARLTAVDTVYDAVDDVDEHLKCCADDRFA